MRVRIYAHARAEEGFAEGYETRLSDGYPILLANLSSLDDLNKRIAASENADTVELPLPIVRFRPVSTNTHTHTHTHTHAHTAGREMTSCCGGDRRHAHTHAYEPHVRTWRLYRHARDQRASVRVQHPFVGSLTEGGPVSLCVCLRVCMCTQNIVVQGLEAWAEDRYKKVTVNNTAELLSVKPCARYVV